MANNNWLHNIRRFASLIMALIVWLLIIVLGTYKLLMYEFAPGSENRYPTTWPKESGLALDATGYTLLMAVHPKCSCSSASLNELSKLMVRFSSQVHAKAFFIAPQNASSDYIRSKNWRAAQNIPNLEIVLDTDGQLANHFHLKTSGATLLYNQNGELAFSGGITASRGHSGDNAGSKAILDIVSGFPTAINKTAAFGCHLFKHSSGATL